MCTQMNLRTDCLKCGALIPEYNEEDDHISVSLCVDCLAVWREFHHKYGIDIEKKYERGKNGHHASWSVFLGELPNLWDKSINIPRKEVVQFT
jgi:hypothetical protein